MKAFLSALAAMSIGASAVGAPITAGDMQQFCESGSPACGLYLQGVYEGIVQAQKNDQTRLVCSDTEPSAAQLGQWFIVAAALAGEGHRDDSAIDMAFVAFKIAMPCS